jgi:catechol 2,3-dioxygenase
VTIAPETRMGPVELTVSDRERSRRFYVDVLGLRVLAEDGDVLRLGADGTELLVLVEEPGARPAVGHTGLFHFALLVPDRRSLARWLAHAARERVALAGASDHFVSEAVYLSDPDLHGIEIYADRPRESWEGQVEAGMTTLPLDVEDLFRELDDPATEPFDGLPAGTTMGHVHLRVAAIPDTLEFYRDVLGFEVMATYGSQAVFLAAGGYHHHVGANTWQSAGAPPPPEGTAALRQATVVLPDAADVDRLAGAAAEAGQEPEAAPDGVAVRDPSGNRLRLVSS